MLRYVLILLALAFALVQAACEEQHAPSILVIAVDRLPFNLSLCTRELEESDHSGFEMLCDESISFTHALTTSTLSVPALDSLMTGLFPEDHGVHHNGSPGLPAGQYTVAEAAIQKGLRTGFFSGGAPVWRKTGLHQGFENFDDSVALTPTRLFRRFSESSDAFFQWLDGEVGDSGFFAVFYVPDLAFIDTVTESSAGERRGLDEESQLEELDASLAKVFRHLKALHRWDDTTIIVTGLNGTATLRRPGELGPLLLNSENTQVSLFIKPSIKPRDEALHWKIDRNVTLADVGRTIFAMLGENLETSQASTPSISLLSSLTTAKPDWDEDRLLPVESGWARWQGWGPLRLGAFRGHDLLLNQNPPRMYNTLVDRLETTPQPVGDPEYDIVRHWQSQGYAPWTPLVDSHLALFQIPALDWLLPVRGPLLLKQLLTMAKAKNADDRTYRWAAELAIEQRDWNALSELGKRANRPAWFAVAERNLGRHASFNDACLDLLMLAHTESKDLRACTDESFLALFAWMKTEAEPEREAARKRFLKTWDVHQLDLKIMKANAGLGLLWLPASAEEHLPSAISLAFALPELRKFSP